MFWPIFLTVIPLFMVYQTSSEKTLSRPIWLLLLGIGVCIWAAFLSSLLELIGKAAPGKVSGISTAINVCSLSLGALGGGLISAAYFQRARLQHFSGMDYLETMKEYNQNELATLEGWLAEIKEDDSKKEMANKLIFEIIETKQEIRKIESELEKRRPAA